MYFKGIAFKMTGESPEFVCIYISTFVMIVFVFEEKLLVRETDVNLNVTGRA